MVQLSVIEHIVESGKLRASIAHYMDVSLDRAGVIALDPSVSTDEEKGVFWLQVNNGNIAHFRFGYALEGKNHPAGTLMVVENILLRGVIKVV